MSRHRRPQPSLTLRLLIILWRILRIFLVAFAAMGPGPPPQPPPPRPPIELREDKGEKRKER